MNESMNGHLPADEALLDLGKVLGQTMAFGTIAGRCSAAQAAALRQARNEKIHARFGLTWNQFCPKHLKMSGTQADEIIRLFQEFGQDYFEHTQSVRISADTYRTVAPYIQDKTLHFQEEVLELNSANVQKVARALRESRRALPPSTGPGPEEPAPMAALSDRLAVVNRRIADLVAETRAIANDVREADRAAPTRRFGPQFRDTLIRACSELKRAALESEIR